MKEAGATMIEVLVTIIVTLIGLLGMLALQLRAYGAESESYQRSQAAILLEDIAGRINTNHAQASAYVANDIGAGEPQDCAGAATIAARDLCEWGNLLRGAAEVDESGNRVGAMLGARACITNPQPDTYAITVVWQGSAPTAAPNATCGQSAFADGNLRRALSTILRIADLAA